MSYWRFIIIGLALIIGGTAYYFVVYRGNRPPLPKTASGPAVQKWTSQISEEPPVLIKVTPLQLGQGADPWKFYVEFTTHSGSLDQDPAQATLLIDDTGQAYQPTVWEGPPPGGHHVTGTLAFKPIAPLPKSVELKIKNIGGIPERSFKWNLE